MTKFQKTSVTKVLTAILGLSIIGQATLWAQINPNAERERVVRGGGTEPRFHSFVIPVDQVKGVALDDMGASAGQFPIETFPDPLWFNQIQKLTRKHFDASTVGWTLLFENPMVAFGSQGGGTPLETNRKYSFGAYGGSWTENVQPTFRIYAYHKGNFGGGATNVPFTWRADINLPKRGDTAAWEQFVENGHRIDFTIPQTGMETTIQVAESFFGSPEGQWGVNSTAWAPRLGPDLME